MDGTLAFFERQHNFVFYKISNHSWSISQADLPVALARRESPVSDCSRRCFEATKGQSPKWTERLPDCIRKTSIPRVMTVTPVTPGIITFLFIHFFLFFESGCISPEFLRLFYHKSGSSAKRSSSYWGLFFSFTQASNTLSPMFSGEVFPVTSSS